MKPTMKQIEQLVDISRRYGADKSYVIAGGGNTSFKTADRLWVKASGHPLGTITVDGFAVMDRTRLGIVAEKTYSSDPATREEQVKADLAAANLTPERRPSVETSMHDAIPAPFVVHLHPTLVGALMSSNRAEEAAREIFGSRALYIPYVDPGYLLFKEVELGIAAYKKAHGAEPQIILLQNHGIFVGGDTPEDIATIYDDVLGAIEARVTEPLPTTDTELALWYAESPEHFRDVSRPFTPDGTVYCGANYIHAEDPDPAAIEKQKEAFRAKFGRDPKVILVKGVGLLTFGDTEAQRQIVTDVYTDMMKIAWLARSFGGPHPMTDGQIEFIDNWEVENYRRSIAQTK
jgi:rhamnose utilization protein RhaD (predicted bifunctional aldolase and dehydrogenase)